MELKDYLGKRITWRTLRGVVSGLVAYVSPSQPDCVIAWPDGSRESATVNVVDIIRVYRRGE